MLFATIVFIVFLVIWGYELFKIKNNYFREKELKKIRDKDHKEKIIKENENIDRKIKEVRELNRLNTRYLDEENNKEIDINIISPIGDSQNEILEKTIGLADSSRVLEGELILEEQELSKLREERLHIHHQVSTKKHSKNKNYENNGGHSKRVWEQLGYSIKPGEIYAYKYYGNEIFKPCQVERKVSYRKQVARSGLTENQLKVKTLGSALVKRTGSKRTAKDILVEEYGFDENTAKYAAGYRGYDDY